MYERDRNEANHTSRQAVPRNMRMRHRFLDVAKRKAPFTSNNAKIGNTQVYEKQNPVLSKVSQDAGSPKRVNFKVVGGVLPLTFTWGDATANTVSSARTIYHDYAAAGAKTVLVTDGCNHTSTIGITVT